MIERPTEGAKLGKERPGNVHSREERAAWMEAMRKEREVRSKQHKERERVKQIKITPARWDAAALLPVHPDDERMIKMLVWELPVERLVQVVDMGPGSAFNALTVFDARPMQTRVASVHVNGVAIDAMRKAINAHGFIPNWQSVQGTGTEAAKQWRRPVDLLLEDSTLDYDSRTENLLAWFKHLRPGALVWCGSYGKEHSGVTLAVEELTRQGRLEQIAVAGTSWAGRFVR
jgi:hypothetical protein